MNKTGEQKVTNGYKCEGYRMAEDLPFDGTFEYTVWITKDRTMSPLLSRYALGLLSSSMFDAEVSGLIVQIDFKQSLRSKVTDQGTIALENEDGNKIKDDEVKYPWLNKDNRPIINYSMPDYTRTINIAQEESVWGDESPSDYQKRIRALFNHITGQIITQYEHWHLFRWL